MRWSTVFLSLLHSHADDRHLGGEHLHQCSPTVLLFWAHPSDIHRIVMSPFSSLRRSIKMHFRLYLIGSAPGYCCHGDRFALFFELNQNHESNPAHEPHMILCCTSAEPLRINIFSCGWSFCHLSRGLRSDFSRCKQLMRPNVSRGVVWSKRH